MPDQPNRGQRAAGRKPSGSTRLFRGALLGACVTLGWLLHDACMFIVSGEPLVFLNLLPGSLVALLVGTLLGALCGRFPVVAVVLAVAGLAARYWPLEVHDALPLTRGPIFTAYTGAVLCAFAVALLVASTLRRALGFSAPVAAACLGLIGALGAGYYGQREPTPHWTLLGGGALVALLLGHRRIPYGRLGSLAAVGLPVLYLLSQGVPEATTSYWRDDLPPSKLGAGDGPNLLLIVLDTVRAESLQPYGRTDRQVSPRLDAWVEDHATLYTQSRSTSSFTLATHGSLFTGTLPAQHKAARLRPASLPLDEHLPTLAERLREHRYQTGAIAANFTYLNPRYDMDRGFEHFDFRKGAWIGRYLALAQVTGKSTWAGHISFRDAASINAAALDWLDRRRTEEPFFLMLNYLDAHTPYITREPHDSMFEDVVFPNPFAVPPEHRELAYERNIHFLDSQIGLLLDEVEARGLMENTLVVITSDHGEAFGEHGLQEHCWTLYDDVIRVPLYIKPPAGRRAARDDRPINTAELTWLILDELGVPYDPPPSMEGLVSEWYRQVPMTDKYMAMAERVDMDLDRDLIAWIEDGRKVIVSTRREVQAFDLAADPDEQHPLELTQDEIDRAVVRAMAWWDANPMAAEQTEEIPPEEMARLRALGYVGQEE